MPGKVINHPDAEREILERVLNKYKKLKEELFTFLNIANAFSDLKRKNRIAFIKAFKRVFNPNDTCWWLIVKLRNTETDLIELKKVKVLIDDYYNIQLINQHLTLQKITLPK